MKTKPIHTEKSRLRPPINDPTLKCYICGDLIPIGDTCYEIVPTNGHPTVHFCSKECLNELHERYPETEIIGDID